MDRIEGCKFQVGDKVWSPSFGEGCVEDIDINSYVRDYPMTVSFGARRKTYTLSGKLACNENVTLFHAGSYIVEAPEPDRMYRPKKGDVVAVSYDNETWAVKIFSHICPNTGKYFASSCSGKGTLYRYDFCEPAYKHFNLPEKDV
jgi:hypothetical protein